MRSRSSLSWSRVHSRRTVRRVLARVARLLKSPAYDNIFITIGYYGLVGSQAPRDFSFSYTFSYS